MIMYCSIILKKCLESGILNTITTPVYWDEISLGGHGRKTIHLMMFTETREDWEIFRSNFSKYGDSNRALVK